MTHKLEIDYIAEILPQEWVLSHMSGSTAQRSGTRMTSPQSIWNWRPTRLNCRSPTGLVEIETSLLNGTHKISHAPGPRARAVISQEPGPDPPVGEYPGEAGWRYRGHLAAAHPEDTDTGGRHVGEHSNRSTLCWQLTSWLISTKTRPHPTACRCQCRDASGQQLAGAQLPTPISPDPTMGADGPCPVL